MGSLQKLWKLVRSLWGPFIIILTWLEGNESFYPCTFMKAPSIFINYILPVLCLSFLTLLIPIDRIIFGDLMKVSLFCFSYCPNLFVFFVQRDDKPLVMKATFKAVLDDPSPFIHNLVGSSPLECRLALGTCFYQTEYSKSDRMSLLSLGYTTLWVRSCWTVALQRENIQSCKIDMKRSI